VKDVIEGDVEAAVRELKAKPGRELQVHGSGAVDDVAAARLGDIGFGGEPGDWRRTRPGAASTPRLGIRPWPRGRLDPAGQRASVLRRARRGLTPRAFAPAGIDNGTISSYCVGVRRKEGALVPLEVSILEAATALRLRGVTEAHGFLLAKEMRDERQARRLTAYGTLYKALERMERAGFLESRWEDPLIGAGEGRPRRRFYRVTLAGEGALARATVAEREASLPRSAAVLPS